MAGSILGNEVLRVEDPVLITGQGTYTGDLRPEGRAFVAFSRSTMPHGDITSIDTSEAEGMPGVLKIYTAANLNVKPFELFFPVAEPLARPPLATDRVRFVGEAFAAVVAETPGQAADAAAMIWADIEPRPAVSDVESATAPGASAVQDFLPNNVIFGNIDPTDPFEDADVIVKVRLFN